MVFMAILTQVILEVINVCKVKNLNLQRKDYKQFYSGIFPNNEMGNCMKSTKTKYLHTILKNLDT